MYDFNGIAKVIHAQSPTQFISFQHKSDYSANPEEALECADTPNYVSFFPLTALSSLVLHKLQSKEYEEAAAVSS